MKRLLISIAVLMVALSGCDIDLFNLGCREIGSSGYSLCRSDDGATVFYLEPNHQAPSGGGVLDGTVQSIGWNDKVIVASRQATFRGDPDGLMVVDLASKQIAGPLDPSAVAKTYPTIRLAKASDTWEALR
jgi:hypothetical protein